MPQTPRIVYSALSRRWYCVTRYRVKQGVNVSKGEPCAYIVATTKHDVTDQMHTIFQSRVGRPKKPKTVRPEATRTPVRPE